MPLAGEYAPSTAEGARAQAELFMSSGGTEGGTIFGRPIILLTTKGNKTEKIRRTPVLRIERAGQYAVVASRKGADNHPSWYHNLCAQPQVDVQDGAVVSEFVAREVYGDERALWWQRAVEVWPAYADYQRQTTRVIPVLVLSKTHHTI
jgi:F420H(2)-dependent quinone reductase